MQSLHIDSRLNEIIGKLSSGMKFGLFEKGMKCYFQDGTHVSYNDLWKAVRLFNNMDSRSSQSLFQLCPDTYVGAHSYKYSKHNWKRSSAPNAESQKDAA